MNKRDLIFYYSLTPEAVEGTKEDVFAAMDEYAKQVAIGFMKWAIYNHGIDGNWDGDIVLNAESHEQLFNQYISSLK